MFSILISALGFLVQDNRVYWIMLIVQIYGIESWKMSKANTKEEEAEWIANIQQSQRTCKNVYLGRWKRERSKAVRIYGKMCYAKWLAKLFRVS